LSRYLISEPRPHRARAARRIPLSNRSATAHTGRR
jgi:hypothetical protein